MIATTNNTPASHVVARIDRLWFSDPVDCIMLWQAIMQRDRTHKEDSLTMNALEALHNRSSVPRLSDPAPTTAVLENIFRAALRAADHAVLRPWRFLVIQGSAREQLGELFVAASLKQEPGLSEEKQQNLRQKPLRAPLIIVTVSSAVSHPKVPAFEQDLSAAAATQNMLLAAYAQDVGAMWRTGSLAYNRDVMRGLGLAEHEKIIAFLYLGTVTGAVKNLNDPPVEGYFKEWQA